MPRVSGWLIVLLLLTSQAGCVGTEDRVRTGWLKRFQDQTITPDLALIEVALIERPFGDDYINGELWKHADELIAAKDGTVDLRLQSALENNGFRLGQLVGANPHGFQQLLLSKRHCANPQAMIFPAGKPVTIFLGPIVPQSTYDFVEDSRRAEVALDQARFCFDVTAAFKSDGRTTLRFTPKVEHGEQAFPFQAVPERSRWELNIGKAAKSYPDLSWEVTLGVNQYLVIGGRPERERSIGQSAFMQYDESAASQRLLVIRNCRSVTTREAHETSVDELIRRDRTPPLAIQASVPASRAKAN